MKARACTLRILLLAVALGLTAFVPDARAADDDVLANAPVVRRLLQHRAGRSELAVQFGSTIGDTYMRNLLPGLRYDLHLYDWLNVGADFAVGIPVQTQMAKDIEAKVQKANVDFTMAASNLKFLGGAHVGVSPLTGKFVAFGALPLAFDVHVNLSVGIASIGGDPVVASGISVAPGVSGGVRLFLTNVVALNLDIGELLVKRTLAVDRNGKAPGAQFSGNTMATFGLSFFLPAQTQRAD